MKKLTILIIILLCANNIKASKSPQLPDYLIYKGDTLVVYSLILENYFNSINSIDKGEIFGLKFREGASFNCWRGYQAIYEIINDTLFVKGIIDCGERYSKEEINTKESNEKLKLIFKNKFKNDRVLADWFTGEFSLPKGDVLRWDGVFYKSFEKEVLVSIKEGKVVNTFEIENYIDFPNRANRRYNDKPAILVFNKLKLLNWKELDDKDCSEEYLIIIGENGTIEKVSMYAYKEEEIKDFWELGEYNYCIRSIKDGLKDLKFDIIKVRGKKVEEEIYLELWYDPAKKSLHELVIDE